MSERHAVDKDQLCEDVVSAMLPLLANEQVDSIRHNAELFEKVSTTERGISSQRG
jgi:hypothetical protein